MLVYADKPLYSESMEMVYELIDMFLLIFHWWLHHELKLNGVQKELLFVANFTGSY